jgi:hypothetical protein
MSHVLFEVTLIAGSDGPLMNPGGYVTLAVICAPFPSAAMTARLFPTYVIVYPAQAKVPAESEVGYVPTAELDVAVVLNAGYPVQVLG